MYICNRQIEELHVDDEINNSEDYKANSKAYMYIQVSH